MPDNAALIRVLAEVQRRGGIGRGRIDLAIAHAEQYVDACPADVGALADLGSGGGLPALVIAVCRPDLHVTLIERRTKRADMLRYAVQALELASRVDVYEGDVLRAHTDLGARFDVVTARSFAPPLPTLAAALPLLVAGGLIVISEPPDGRPRWTFADLNGLQLIDTGRVGGVRRFRHL